MSKSFEVIYEKDKIEEMLTLCGTWEVEIGSKGDEKYNPYNNFEESFKIDIYGYANNLYFIIENPFIESLKDINIQVIGNEMVIISGKEPLYNGRVSMAFVNSTDKVGPGTILCGLFNFNIDGINICTGMTTMIKKAINDPMVLGLDKTGKLNNRANEITEGVISNKVEISNNLHNNKNGKKNLKKIILYFIIISIIVILFNSGFNSKNLNSNISQNSDVEKENEIIPPTVIKMLEDFEYIYLKIGNEEVKNINEISSMLDQIKLHYIHLYENDYIYGENISKFLEEIKSDMDELYSFVTSDENSDFMDMRNLKISSDDIWVLSEIIEMPIYGEYISEDNENIDINFLKKEIKKESKEYLKEIRCFLEPILEKNFIKNLENID